MPWLQELYGDKVIDLANNKDPALDNAVGDGLVVQSATLAFAGRPVRCTHTYTYTHNIHTQNTITKYTHKIHTQNTHTYSHTHIHTYTHTHIHTYTHTHIHTYTPAHRCYMYKVVI